jgi:membrane glycosyltransferase
MKEVFYQQKQELSAKYVGLLHLLFCIIHIDFTTQVILFVIFYVNKKEKRKAVTFRVFILKTEW